MSYKVAIIGSFQKYYDEIVDMIGELKKQGLVVCSPKESYINKKIGDFVIFASDSQTQTPVEIQTITLGKIMQADAVYVYNPTGYVGKTTCFEIGFCISRQKPIYFLEKPEDLPILCQEDVQVVSPARFANLVSNKKQEFVYDYGLCNEAKLAFNRLFDLENSIEREQEKKIVICGSMYFYDEMVKCQKELLKMGIKSIVPKEENDIIQNYNAEQFKDFKRRVSNNYFRKIREKNTGGVLIYNAEKNGKKNYIGANTLVELAMAFTWNRKIFLYNDFYDALKDELLAWECICLHGNLSSIKKYFDPTNLSKKPSEKVAPPNNGNNIEQLTFF